MKTSVDLEKFLVTVGARPSLVKSIVDPSEPLILRLIEANLESLKYLPDDVKTKTVCDTAMEKIHFWLKKSSWQHKELNVVYLPADYRKSLSPQTKMRLIEYSTELIADLFCSYNEWLRTAPKIWKWEDIPNDHHTKEMVAAFVSEYANKVDKIPTEMWTSDLLTYVLTQAPRCISFISKDVLDERGFRAAFTKASESELGSTFAGWDKWTPDLAEIATAQGKNLGAVPDKLKTYDMCMRCCKTEEVYDDVPKRYRDRAMYLASIIRAPQNADKVEGWGKDPKFQKDVAQTIADMRLDDDAKGKKFDGLTRRCCLYQITEATWLEILRILPQAIRAIEKKDQTKEMVRLAIEGLSPETIDDFIRDNHINRSRITKDLAPLLAGTESTAAQQMMARKLNPVKREKPQRVEAPVATYQQSNSVMVNMSPKELENLKLL